MKVTDKGEGRSETNRREGERKEEKKCECGVCMLDQVLSSQIYCFV